jgi:hypothetical protein
MSKSTTCADKQLAHTPGPWSVLNAKNNEGQICIVSNDPNRESGDILAFVVDNDEQLANAHLFAAAPDLLETLEDVSGVLSLLLCDRDLPATMRNHYQHKWNRIQSVLAKAEGK